MKNKLSILVSILIFTSNIYSQNQLDFSKEDAIMWYETYAFQRDQRLSMYFKEKMNDKDKYESPMVWMGARSTVGCYYLYGILPAQNRDKIAYNSFSKAAKKNNFVGKFYVADLLLRGKGIESNPTEAYLILKSMRNDDMSARILSLSDVFFAQGFIEFYGLGDVEKDEASALSLFTKAAKDIPEASLFIGLQYFYGRGTSVNYQLAEYHLNSASDRGIYSLEKDRCLAIIHPQTNSEEIIPLASKPHIGNESPTTQKHSDYAVNTPQFPSKTIQKKNGEGKTNRSGNNTDGEKDPSSNIDTYIPKNSTTNNNTFALIISNENYNKLAHVPYALRDGEIFAKYCNKTLGIPEENIRIYRNATYGGMIAAIDDMKSIAKAYGENNINIIVYYAGHGAPHDATKEAYLIPVDAYNVNSKICYALKDFYADLSNMKAKKIIVFLDACFSGSARAEDGTMLASARGIAISSKKENLEGNMVVLSATNGSETALPYEKEKHGLFTYFLLKKIQESKGKVTMQELSEYIKTNVARQSIVINRKAQTPTINASLQAQGWKEWTLN